MISLLRCGGKTWLSIKNKYFHVFNLKERSFSRVTTMLDKHSFFVLCKINISYYFAWTHLFLSNIFCCRMIKCENINMLICH